MKRLIALLVFGVFAFGDTIPVTGVGSFFLTNFSDIPSSADVRFTGSDGTNSVSLQASIPIGSGGPPSDLSADSLMDNLYLYSSATVDGTTSNYWSLSLRDGYASYLNILDGSGNVLISQAIQGEIQITSYVQNGPKYLSSGYPSDEWTGTGTFNISPVPEASSGLLLSIGICCIALAWKRKASTRF